MAPEHPECAHSGFRKLRASLEAAEEAFTAQDRQVTSSNEVKRNEKNEGRVSDAMPLDKALKEVERAMQAVNSCPLRPTEPLDNPHLTPAIVNAVRRFNATASTMFDSNVESTDEEWARLEFDIKVVLGGMAKEWGAGPGPSDGHEEVERKAEEKKSSRAEAQENKRQTAQRLALQAAENQEARANRTPREHNPSDYYGVAAGDDMGDDDAALEEYDDDDDDDDEFLVTEDPEDHTWRP